MLAPAVFVAAVLQLYVVCVVCLHVAAAAAASPETKQFLWLSDLHLDPLYGTVDAVGSCVQPSDAPALGRQGCDAPRALVQEAIQQAAADGVAEYFVILTGDLCRHGTDRLSHPMETTKSILRNVSQMLRNSLDVSILPSIGNNDVTPDYYLNVQNPTETLSMVTQGLELLLESDQERETFLQGGYLIRNVSSSLTVISLNTVLYSTNHIPLDDGRDDDNDPLGQFKWLENQLNLACGSWDRDVYIVGHIPPVMGSYQHSQLWQTTYLAQYYSILQRTYPCVKGQLFGHLHADEFRWIAPSSAVLDSIARNGSNNLRFPLWLASSVTPIYGSNPSYRWVSYQADTNAILDYDTHYLDLLNPSVNDDPHWKKGPSFRESFQIPDLNYNGMQELVQGLNRSILETNSTLWQALLDRQHIYVSGDEELACRGVSCRRAWMCTLTTVTSEEYAMCLQAAGGNPLQVIWYRWSLRKRIKIGAMLALSTIFVLCLVLCRCCPRYIRRRHYQQSMPLETEDDGILLEHGHQQNAPEPKHRPAASLTTAPTSSSSSSSLETSYQEEDGAMSALPAIA